MSQLIISVSGVRGTIGQCLDKRVVERFGRAYAAMLGESKCVVLARDSRPSGAEFSRSMGRTLTEMGLDVIDLGIVTTPGAALMVTKFKAAGAVIITASHNPGEWNGLKFLGPDGLGVSAEDMDQVSRLFFDDSSQPSKTTRKGSIRHDESTHDIHTSEVLGLADVETVKAKQYRVVLDSINGAGGAGGRLLLEELGCEVIHINGQADGEFAHSPEPIAENLTGLCEAVIENKADAGFAQDPDADRLAIVDEQGEFIGEEYTLALAVMGVLAKDKGPVATNMSTSRMIDDLAERAGVEVFRTPVGEAHVARAVREHKCVIGGEGNGGVIDPNVVTVRDSFSGMSLVLQLMAESGKTVSQLVGEIPRYCMLKTKFTCERQRAKKVLEAVGQKFADKKVNRSDGVRIDWPEGWVHVRSSNTEPIMRVFAEAGDESKARELLGRIEEVLKEE